VKVRRILTIVCSVKTCVKSVAGGENIIESGPLISMLI
jgi:hypothetical protein